MDMEEENISVSWNVCTSPLTKEIQGRNYVISRILFATISTFLSFEFLGIYPNDMPHPIGSGRWRIGPLGKLFKNHLFWNCLTNLDHTFMELSLCDPLLEMYLITPLASEERWHFLNTGPYGKICSKIFSKPVRWIGTKLYRNGSLAVPFQNYIRWPCLSTKTTYSTDIILT